MSIETGYEALVDRLRKEAGDGTVEDATANLLLEAAEAIEELRSEDDPG